MQLCINLDYMLLFPLFSYITYKNDACYFQIKKKNRTGLIITKYYSKLRSTVIAVIAV